MQVKELTWHIAPWTSFLVYGVIFSTSRSSKANFTFGRSYTNGLTLSSRSDHLVPDMPWSEQPTSFANNFHLLEMQLNRVYIACIVPKKVIATGIHSAVSLPHKISVWRPQGDKIVVGYCSFTIACAPLYLPDMLATLTQPCALQSASGIAWPSNASMIIWAISDPVMSLQSTNVRNRSSISNLIHGNLRSAKGMLLAQHEMNLLRNPLLMHGTLQTSFLTKRAA